MHISIYVGILFFCWFRVALQQGMFSPTFEDLWSPNFEVLPAEMVPCDGPLLVELAFLPEQQCLDREIWSLQHKELERWLWNQVGICWNYFFDFLLWYAGGCGIFNGVSLKANICRVFSQKFLDWNPFCVFQNPFCMKTQHQVYMKAYSLNVKSPNGDGSLPKDLNTQRKHVPSMSKVLTGVAHYPKA